MLLIQSLIDSIQTISNEPNTAEWMQGWGTIAAAVIALPGTIAAFIVLFRKDKDKQNQIDKLTTIIDELRNQTAEFSLQTNEMKEYNQILKDQFDLQFAVQGDTKKFQDQMAELKKKELKSRNKPLFIFHQGQSDAKHINISIKNIGQTAKLTDFIEVGDNKLTFTTMKGLEVGKDKIFQLKADYKGQDNLHSVNKLIEIICEDSVGNTYKQKIKIKGSNAEILQIEGIN